MTIGLHCHDNKRRFSPALARLCSSSPCTLRLRDGDPPSARGLRSAVWHWLNGLCRFDVFPQAGLRTGGSEPSAPSLGTATLHQCSQSQRGPSPGPAHGKGWGWCAGGANPAAPLLWLNTHLLLSSRRREGLFTTIGHLCRVVLPLLQDLQHSHLWPQGPVQRAGWHLSLAGVLWVCCQHADPAFHHKLLAGFISSLFCLGLTTWKMLFSCSSDFLLSCCLTTNPSN